MLCQALAASAAPRPGPVRRIETARRAAACFCAAWLAAAVHAAPPMVPAGKTVEVADGVYVIPDGGIPLVPNVGILVGEESVLVIDTGMGPANAEIVLSEVRKVSQLPVRYLVTTHFHPEHNFGAQSFPTETLLLYPIAQHRDLQEKGEEYRDWFIEMFGDDVQGLLEPVELVEPDLTFERQARLDLGDFPVHLLWFGHPAHTGGDTVIYLPRQKVAFVGGLAPNKLFPIMADAGSSVRGWLASLEPLARLNARIIVPDHGKVGRPAVIEAVREYLSTVQAASLKLKRGGVPLNVAQETLHAEFSERYADWGENHWIRNAVERTYAEAEND